MTVTFDPLITGLERVLDLRMAQHALTASNLANADTPGYHAKVIDFDTALARAVSGGLDLDVTRTDPRHVDVSGMDPANPPMIELEAPPWSMDDNSVLPERETARLQTNALMYDAVARGLDHKLDLLRFAVTDGRS